MTDYITHTLNTQSPETETLFRKARGARIECERLDLQLQASLKRALAICAAMLAAACGQLEIDAPASEADAGTPAAAPAVPKVGDPCMCCVWAPETAYPNGDVYCMHGKVEVLAGLMCHAWANDTRPEWAPASVGCVLGNPWGK